MWQIYYFKIESNHMSNSPEKNFQNLSTLLYSLFVLLIGIFLFLGYNQVKVLFVTSNDSTKSYTATDSNFNHLWTAPSDWRMMHLSKEEKELVLYGRELIAHTSQYLGPKGSVQHSSNGMNCQNCHLNAGTQPWGNNYFAVQSTYPKFRARSGTKEDQFKRVNDCFERSLNGKPLGKESKEMRSILAYIKWLGSDIEKGKVPKGAGIFKLKKLKRAADPSKGKGVYAAKCQSCHQANGEGILAENGQSFIYPPLWGPHSYNIGAGLYRISNFAGFVKYNMPLGTTYDKPQLSNEEAWDIAAFVNSMPRPNMNLSKDWPDISKKPFDHPFGPYSDGQSELRHKFGPYEKK
jgi:thiosulfate dehydrogenase